MEVSFHLKTALQCTKAVTKAMQVLGLIRRNFVMIDAADYRLLFSSYVRPHSEYCVQVWSPYLREDIDCIEKVQCRATILVRGLKYKSYGERLALFQTTSLENRRIRGDLIQVFLTVKGFNDVNQDNFLELDDGGYSLRGHGGPNMTSKVHKNRCNFDDVSSAREW